MTLRRELNFHYVGRLYDFNPDTYIWVISPDWIRNIRGMLRLKKADNFTSFLIRMKNGVIEECYGVTGHNLDAGIYIYDGVLPYHYIDINRM